jgi:hypothetical protein
MVRRLLLFLLAGVFLAGLGLGCGDSAKERNIHKHRDRPRVSEREER